MSIWKREIYKHSRRAYFCTVKSQFFYFGQFGQIFRTSPRKCGTPYIFRRKRKWDFSSSLKLPNYFLVTIRRKSKLQMLLSPEPRPLIGWPIRASGSCLSLNIPWKKRFKIICLIFWQNIFFRFWPNCPFRTVTDFVPATDLYVRTRFRSRKIAILSLNFTVNLYGLSQSQFLREIEAQTKSPIISNLPWHKKKLAIFKKILISI